PPWCSTWSCWTCAERGLSEVAYRLAMPHGVKSVMARHRKRKSISPAELFAILDEAFERERPPACESCRIPLPYRIPRTDAAAANWELGPASRCDHRCAACI